MKTATVAASAAFVVVWLLTLTAVRETRAVLFTRNPRWKTLSVTWGPVPRIPLLNDYFSPMPLQTSQAGSFGFVPVPESTACASGNFLGFRYYKPADPALVLLFDKNGYIAGIQNTFSKSVVESNPITFSFYKNNWYQRDTVNGNDAYTVTAYFVDPAIICTTGRSQQDFETGGQGMTGSQLSFQTGPNPLTDNVRVPIDKTEIDQSKIWGGGRCFPSMGNHYWYNTSLNMDCTNFRPAFLLYNAGKLTAFGFAAAGLSGSSRFEHPPKLSFGLFFNPVPQCIYAAFDNVGSFSTMHIFFNVDFEDTICI